MSTFEARYEGWCAAGRDRIKVGDPIVDTEGGYVHADCAPVEVDPLPPVDPKKLCPSCFMEHAGECM